MTAPNPGFSHPDAACKGVNPDMFFPEHGNSEKDMAPALNICRQCPEECRTQCLEHAVTWKEAGIWGGTTGRQRRTMRTTGATTPPPHNPRNGGNRPPGHTRSRILEELRVANRWMTTRELADILGLQNNSIQLAVRRLRDTGELQWEYGGYCRHPDADADAEVEV